MPSYSVNSNHARDIQPNNALGLSGFLAALFTVLNEHSIRYCVLNLPDPDSPTTDFIELAVDGGSQKRLPELFQLLRQKGYPPIVYLAAGVGTDHFHFALSAGTRPELRRVDIVYPQTNPLLFRLRDQLFARSRQQGNYWIADSAHQSAYQSAKTHHNLSRANNFGARIQNVIGEGRRLVHNWFHCPGVQITILGPDGAGKTTLAKRIFNILGPTFGPQKLLLWRPEVLPRLSRDSDALALPHSKPPHGVLSSLLRISAIFADYWVGHFVLVKPLLSRSALILYDRDIHDVLVDSRRYRYGGPMWLPRLLTKLLPHTEALFLVLDASPETILGRKQEVPCEEVQRQLEAYRRLAAQLPDSYLIQSSDDIESTASAVVRCVVDYLGRRYDRRHARANSSRTKREHGVRSWVRQ